MEKKTEVGIRNMEMYLELMKKGMYDKLFFFDKLFESVDTFVDFGCADGSMLRSLHFLSPSSRLIGYDISEQMIDIAKENMPEAEFYTDWSCIDLRGGEGCVTLSSVIHEVYCYSSAEDVEVFWERILKSGFKYIAIRDMMPTDTDENPLSDSDFQKVRKNKKYASVLASYEEVNGTITTPRQLLHYLMKYQYTDNWEREVRENYLPITAEELFALMPTEYECVYYCHETLPYLAHCVKRDFDISLKMKTHAKILFKRKD